MRGLINITYASNKRNVICDGVTTIMGEGGTCFVGNLYAGAGGARVLVALMPHMSKRRRAKAEEAWAAWCASKESFF